MFSFVFEQKGMVSADCRVRRTSLRSFHLVFCYFKWFQVIPRQNVLAFNPIQAGVFWNHIGWGAHCAPLCFSFICGPNTTNDGTLGQNLSKAIKILLTSSLGGKYDVIKLSVLVSLQVKIRVPLSFVQLS